MSRNDGYADWDALMVPEGDALAQLACGKPARFPIIDAQTRLTLFWLCPEHKETGQPLGLETARDLSKELRHAYPEL